MTRLSALVVLIALAIGPVLAGLCEHPCGETPVREAAADCHGSAGTGQKLVSGHDCSTHTVVATPATRETRYDLRLTWLVPTVEVPTLSRAAIVGAGADIDICDSDPPHLVRLTPLRI